jgi:hypothetical protein
LVYSLTLEYAFSRVQVIHDGLKLNRIHLRLVYADYVNILEGIERGATLEFPEYSQRVAGVLRQTNSCSQARLNMFQLASTLATDQMSRLFPSSRGSSTLPWYTVGGKTSNKYLEQRINIKFLCEDW